MSFILSFIPQLLDQLLLSLPLSYRTFSATSEECAQDKQSVTTINHLPPEVLSAIFSIVLSDSSPNRTRARAIDFLSFLHINHFLRQVAKNDPSLWSSIGFLNGVHPDFLDAILRESQSVPLSLAFTEDPGLSNDNTLWNRVTSEFQRVRTLHVTVSSDSEGDRLRGLLSTPMPCLEECTITFQGNRNKRLEFGAAFVTPRLRSLQLSNCFVPLELYRPHGLNKVTHHSMSFHGSLTGISFPSTRYSMIVNYELRRTLRSLVIDMALAPTPADDFERMRLRTPLELPLLESLVLKGSLSVCEHLGHCIAIPDKCTREVTICFTEHPAMTLGQADVAARVAWGFLPDVQYHHSWISCNGELSSIHLVSMDKTVDAKISFDFRNLTVRIPGGLLATFVDALGRLPSFALCHIITPEEFFCCVMWKALAFNCRLLLASPEQLHISFSLNSFTPHLVEPVFARMVNVQTVTICSPQNLSNIFLTNAIRSKVFPKLTALGISLKEELSPTALLDISNLTWWRKDIVRIRFHASPLWVREHGHAGLEAIRVYLGHMTQGFSDRIRFELVEE
ncbi:hypothetical protein EST38_g10941 [Candolleomyces aberdarensis]|uniref:F-box domain-containing protein n=1 Tax=Candolleomyces aberdarensis TaxID=2316362 RepID=A0A4Q2D645_9AGAR|nr:hypothetical protein EST38_g10941 [Candolleomyces aberdarensis]